MHIDLVSCFAMKAVTGIAADGRKLASEAKAHARTYRRNFGSPIPPKVYLSYFFCTQTNSMSFLRVKYLNLSLLRFHAISFQALASQIGSLLHAYTCYGALRPFGSSILISGVDPTTKEHELYMSDPSGTTLVYIGSFEFTCPPLKSILLS